MNRQENQRLNHKLSKVKLAKIEKSLVNKQFKEWSLAVRNRDNNKCVVCGSSKMLNAHHIIPRENKDFRFDINNGISLCVLHHKFSLEISPHRNPFVFIFWLADKRNEQTNYLIDKLQELARQ